MSWQYTAAKELAEDQDIDSDDLAGVVFNESYAPGGGVYIEFRNDDFLVFRDALSAERAAYDYTEEKLDEWFYGGFPAWGEDFIEPDLVAIREYALSDADSYSQDITFDDALMESGLDAEYDALLAKHDWEQTDEYNPKSDNYRPSLVAELREGQDLIEEKARAKVAEEHYDLIYREMSFDIVGFLKDNFGYDNKEILDSGLVRYDERGMAEYIVDNDGEASVFSSDGEEIDLPSGAVAYRTN